MQVARQIHTATLRMNNDNDLKSVDSGNWFHTLITRSEKNTALDLCTNSYLQNFREPAV